MATKPTDRVNILLVDDEPAGLVALTAVLAELGENLVRATSGEEALKKVLTTDFAAILLDVRMPTMSGFETARIIRSRPRSSRTPILFLTAAGDADFAVEEAYALGAVDYLVKPVAPVVLRAKVAFFVELKRKTDELAQAERERHRVALDAKDERLRLLLDNTQYYAFVTTDRDGRITEWEGGAQAISGWTPADAVGQAIDILFTPEDLAVRQPDVEQSRALQTGRALDKRWHQRKDGGRFFADGVLVPLKDDAGRSRGFAKIFRDATPERLADDSLRASEEWQRATLASIGDGVIVTDAQGRVTTLNGVAQKLTGWTQADAAGTPLTEVFRIINESTRQVVENPALRALADGVIVGLANHTLLLNKDGSERPIDDSAAPVRGEEGKLFGAVLVFRDIAEKKRAEAERERLRRAVQAANDQLTSVFQKAPAFMCVLIGPEHEFALINDRYLQLVGGRAVIGQPVREALPEVVGQGFLELLDGVYQTGEAFVGTEGRLLLQRHPGEPLEERFVDFVYLPMRDASGAVSGILVHGVDLTERKRARDLTARQQEALELAVAGSPLPAILNVLIRAAEEYAGGSVRAAVLLRDGQHLRHGAAPSLPAAFNQAIDGLMVGPAAVLGGPSDAAADIQTDPRWADLRELAAAHDLRSCWSTPIRSSDGQVLGTFAFYYRDVREPAAAEREAMVLLASTTALLLDRHRQTHERRAAQDRLRLATDAAELAVWVWDSAADQVTWENDRLYDMLHLSRAEAPVNAARFVADFIYPDDADSFGQALKATVETGARFYFQGRFRRTDGELRWIEFTGRRQPTVDGSAVQVLGTAADITPHKRAETDLRRLAADLSEADRRKTEFLATLAHELRNPLAPIRNGLEVMQLAADNPVVVARARDIMERQLGHMVHLVNDLLDIARITSGKVDLKKARIDLKSVVASAVETSLPLIEASHHELVLSLPAEPLPLDVDPTRLAQVVSNLLNNAAKYTPNAGRIELSARREGREVVVAVTDTGVGIPDESLPSVFEMFNQVGRNLHRAQGGLGIGLTLVRRLVELHGGTVTAHSPGTGKGSTFVVRLPLADSADSPVAEPAPLPPTGAARKLRILVVDDNQDAAESLAELLQMGGHPTQVAHDGRQALQRVREFQPEVIFLDIGMPEMNGYEVARAIRQTPGTAGIVLVALTGWGAESDRARSQAAGFDEHLTKPAELTALRSLIEKLARAAAAATDK